MRGTGRARLYGQLPGPSAVLLVRPDLPDPRRLRAGGTGGHTPRPFCRDLPPRPLSCVPLDTSPPWPSGLSPAGGLEGFPRSLRPTDGLSRYSFPLASLSRSPKSTSPPGRTRLPLPPRRHSTCSRRTTPPSSPATAPEAKAGAPCLLLRRRVSRCPWPWWRVGGRGGHDGDGDGDGDEGRLCAWAGCRGSEPVGAGEPGR